jgi:hypothetical protein
MLKIQVNGGSLFLDESQQIHLPLEQHLKDAHVEHFSIPGKSNQSIVMDVYEHINKFDIFVLNFTFTDRFPLWLDDYQFEMSMGRIIPGMLPLPKFEANADFLEETIIKFTKMYYKYFCNIEYNNKFNNMLVDSCILLLKQHNKKFILSNCQALNIIDPERQYWYNDPTASVYDSTTWTKFLDKQFGHLPKQHFDLLSQEIFEFGIQNNIW